MKKSVLALFVFAAAILLHASAFAEDEVPAAVIDYGQFNTENGEYAVYYHTGGAEDGTVISAAYDGDGRLIAVGAASLTDSTSVFGSIILKIPEASAANTSVRLFLWDGLDTIQPFAASELMQLSEIPSAPSDFFADFGREEFKSIGKITEVTECGDLTFFPWVNGGDMQFNERGFLDMPEWHGSNTNCAVKLHVMGSCRITLYARSRSNEVSRPLLINNSSGDNLCEFEFPPQQPISKSFDYIGDEDDIYITTKEGPVLLYSIEVMYGYDGIPVSYEVSSFGELETAVRHAKQYGSGTVFINSDWC